MQINSIGALNTVKATNFGNKEKCCNTCCNSDNNSTVTMPRHSYNRMMGLAALAMAIGGPLAMTSCDPAEDFPKPDIPDVTDTITVETAEQTETQANMKSLVSSLGVFSTQKSAVVDTCFVKKGDITEMRWHDNYFKDDIKLKINDDLCTKTKMIYDGTKTNTMSGDTTYVRHTFTSDGDGGVNEKIEMTDDMEPINKNSKFINIHNYHYVKVEDGVIKYIVNEDGSEEFDGKYIPDGPTSIVCMSESGIGYPLTDVFVVQK